MLTPTRLRIRLRGIVQGVGFRPFVHNLALKHKLNGFVLNSSAGLITEVEGDPAELASFLTALAADAPPLAWIQETETKELDPTGEIGFVIRHSVAVTGEFALISPDVATCADCLRDITDPANRRYGYAFTNCTNCGPRYTIIRDIPYDRPNTTMAEFRMCPACQAEYDDPADRRFHAQPNACPACGPRALRARLRKRGDAWRRARSWPSKDSADSTWPAMRATKPPSDRLRQRKRRSDKPFALMARDLAAARCSLRGNGERSGRAARARSRPIVILRAALPPGPLSPPATPRSA